MSISPGQLHGISVPPSPAGEPRSLALATIGAASRTQAGLDVSARGRLVISGIDVNFAGSTVQALQDVSLTCDPGEFVVVVGPSGCGKSTLLNVVAGMVKPRVGTVELDGRRYAGPGPERAMVFQEHGLFPWLSAAQNIEFGLKMLGMPKSEREDRVDAALQLVHLQTKRDKLPHELSGGMKQPRRHCPRVGDGPGRSAHG